MTQSTDDALRDASGANAERRPRARRRSPALGSDPFAQSEDEPDPFLEHLGRPQRTNGALTQPPDLSPTPDLATNPDLMTNPDLRTTPTLTTPPTPTLKSTTLEPATPKSTTPKTTTLKPNARLASPSSSLPALPPTHEPDRPKEREWIEVPELAEVELPEPTSWADRLLSDEDRRRVASLAKLLGEDAAYDRFGLSIEVVRNTLPIMMALYRVYFRVRSHGHEHIRKRGPVILAGNHAGVLPFDAAMVVTDLLLKCNPARLARMVVDCWAGTLPWINVFYARSGQVIGTNENFADLLASGQAVAVFPEGMRGAIKPFSERYQLQEFRVGFIEQSLASGAPIVPTAIVGSDDQMPILFDLGRLAKLLGLPVFPITPTFPWLGPLGLLPYPVSYEIVYGEPLRFYESYSPEDARDPELLRALPGQVRNAVQRLIDLYR